MILIFDYYDTLIHNKSMDFNRGLIGLWEKYYKDKCSFEEIKAFGEEMYLHILELHKQGKEWAFVKDELPEYAKKFGGETIPMTSEEEADFLMTCHEVETMPNIPEALMEFEKMGIPMYILSNSGFTAEALSIVLERFGIRRFFQKIWSSADFGKIKPDKDLFEMVVENALTDYPGEGREDIVFVGDTYRADVIGAHGAGLDVIWINHNGEQNQDKLPIHIISHTRELTQVVRELKGKTYQSLLETKRLVIRNFEREDTPSCLMGWGRDKNLGKYILGYPTEEKQMEAFVSSWAENKNAWVIVEKESQNCVGYVTVDIPYMQLGIGEIGYVIGERYQHKGYAYEALQYILQEYLVDRRLYMLEAKYNVSNVASGNLLKKLGFRVDGELRNRRIDMESGKRKNLIICSITKEELQFTK